MTKIIKLRGLIREYTVAVGAYSGGGGGLLTICSPRVGAYSSGGFFKDGGGGNSRIYRIYYELFLRPLNHSFVNHSS